MEKEELSSSTWYPGCVGMDQGMSGVNIRRHFFTQRVIKHWNRLSRAVVDALGLSVLETFGQCP